VNASAEMIWNSDFANSFGLPTNNAVNRFAPAEIVSG
jgi:hypothetical protein